MSQLQLNFPDLAEVSMQLNEATITYDEQLPYAQTLDLITTILNGSPQIADELTKAFPTLREMYNASITQLVSIEGIGVATAKRIKASLELGRRLVKYATQNRAQKFSCPSEFADYLMPEMVSLEQEHLIILCLNQRNQIIKEHRLYIGNVNTSVIRIAEIMRLAVHSNAVSIVMAHNHPSGDPSPSSHDIAVTNQVHEAGQLLQITLLDHLVIGHGNYRSLRADTLGPWRNR